MKECQAITPLIFMNATLEAACEFPLANESLNLERLKAEVLADDARVDLNDAIIDFNLGHRRVPLWCSITAGCMYDSTTMRPRADVTLLHLLCKPEKEPPRSRRGLLTFLN
jgi:hypothetical protein